MKQFKHNTIMRVYRRWATFPFTSNDRKVQGDQSVISTEIPNNNSNKSGKWNRQED